MARIGGRPSSRRRRCCYVNARIRTTTVVTRLNQTPITDIDQFKQEYQELRKKSPKEAVVLEATRQGQDEIIRIEPPR